MNVSGGLEHGTRAMASKRARPLRLHEDAYKYGILEEWFITADVLQDLCTAADHTRGDAEPLNALDTMHAIKLYLFRCLEACPRWDEPRHWQTALLSAARAWYIYYITESPVDGVDVLPLHYVALLIGDEPGETGDVDQLAIARYTTIIECQADFAMSVSFPLESSMVA